MYKITIATLFPNLCLEVLNTSILLKAAKLNLVSYSVLNIRDFAFNKHKRVDDVPFGGGYGMLMMAEPIYRCYEYAKLKTLESLHVVYLTPKGEMFNQRKALKFSKMKKPLFLICGHYEGIDQRLIDEIVDEQISIGDYVLTGGELAAMVVVDAVVRLLPNVLSNEECYENESLFENLLEYPQYTKPRTWNGRTVPEVLLSGDHAKIASWRKNQAYLTTKKLRPDLLERFKE